MKKITINGFTYFWNGSKLFEDEAGTNEINQKFMTPNEKQQLETWIEYNGIPMYSF